MANAPLQWYQGESHKMTIAFFESDGITPKPIADYTNILFWIYNSKSGGIFGKYALIATPDFNTTDVGITDVNELTVKIQHDKTVNAELGLHVIEVKEMLTDVDMDDNVLRLIGKKEFFIMNPAKSKMI